MPAPSLTKDQILQDIESIYQRAFADGKWTVALRAKEMQGKSLGLFQPQRLPRVVRIADMTQEQLGEFIKRLEENEPELKGSAPVKPETADQGPGAGLTGPEPAEPEADKKDSAPAVCGTATPATGSPPAPGATPAATTCQWHNGEIPTNQAEKHMDNDHPPPFRAWLL